MLTAGKNAGIDSYIALQAIHLKPEIHNDPDVRVPMEELLNDMRKELARHYLENPNQFETM